MFTSISIETGLALLILAFAAEYLDSSVGMGYGTSLTPILLILGFDPLQIVPAILMSELVSGLLGGMLHSRAGNSSFQFKTYAPGNARVLIKKHGIISFLRLSISRDLKTVLVISVFSIIGTSLSVGVALSISKFALKTYIGVLVVIIGLLILLTAKKNFSFSWSKIILLSIIASFNKGISGGGYGPVVTGGQLLSGVNDKSAIGITSLSEGLTCAAGISLYLLFSNGIDFSLFPFLITGAVISVPFSVLTVKKMNTDNLRYIIGICAIALGLFTLGKLFL